MLTHKNNLKINRKTYCGIEIRRIFVGYLTRKEMKNQEIIKSLTQIQFDMIIDILENTHSSFAVNTLAFLRESPDFDLEATMANYNNGNIEAIPTIKSIRFGMAVPLSEAKRIFDNNKDF